jgi:transposase-like protein
MPSIAYYLVVKGKDRKLKYETRYNLVMTALQQGIKPTARFFGVSRNMFRKWLRRFQALRIAGLEELSRAPKRIPHKTDTKMEALAIELKKRLPRFGSRRLKHDFGLKCSHGALLDRIFRQHSLIKRRKRKRQRQNDLRAEKARYKAFERTCNDTKYLTDIPEYWTQAKTLCLPWFQYSHRDVRTGVMLLGYADELSLSHATIFAETVIHWYQSHQIKLEGSTWSYDGGSEYIGSANAKRNSSYQEVLVRVGINGLEIPKTTYNAEVETIHNTIEFEFFEIERFINREDFFKKVTAYQLWYNCLRKNCYRNNKSPLEILKEIAPEINPKLLLLPVIDLDLALENRLTLNSPNSLVGGHDVPRYARRDKILLDKCIVLR